MKKFREATDQPDKTKICDDPNLPMDMPACAEGPDTADVHVDQPAKTTAKPPKGRNQHFINRMMSQLCAKFSDEELVAMVKHARAHAGGMSAAEARRLKATLGDDFESDDVEMSEPGLFEHDVADLCATGADCRLFVEHLFAEPPEWMPLLPKPGKYQHPEYGEIKITRGRNQNFVDNFTKGVYQSSLPVNTEHAPDSAGAYGWIEQLRLNEDGSVDARVKWTDRGSDAIRNDRFRYISPEWADSWEDPAGQRFKDVLRGAALTVRPYFKDKFLRPLVATENKLFASTTGQQLADNVEVYFFSALEPSGPAASLAISNSGDKSMPEDIKDKAPAAEPEKTATEPITPITDARGVTAQQFAEVSGQVKTLTELTERQSAEIKALTEVNVKLAADGLKKRIQDEIKGRIEGGVKWHGDHQKHAEFLAKLAKAFGEDSDDYKQYVNDQRTIAKQMADSSLFAEIGSRGGDQGGAESATEKITTLTKAKMAADPKLSFAEAQTIVITENPQLYVEHARANTVRV